MMWLLALGALIFGVGTGIAIAIVYYAKHGRPRF